MGPQVVRGAMATEPASAQEAADAAVRKFRVAADTGYLRRHRLTRAPVSKPSTPPPQVPQCWSIVPKSLRLISIKASNDRVSGSIACDGVTGPALPFELAFLACGAVRFAVREGEPLHPRYEVSDIFREDAIRSTVSASMTSSAPGVTCLEVPAARILLHWSPFRLQVYHGDTLHAEVNANDLLHYETLRPRPQDLPALRGSDVPLAAASYNEAGEALAADGTVLGPAQARAAEAAAELTQRDPHGLWDEYVVGVPDAKPRGPESVGFDILFPGVARVFGLPEHSTPLNLPSTLDANGVVREPYRLWNLDAFHYALDDTAALYGAVPLAIAAAPSHAVGVLSVNASETWVDVWRSSAGTGMHFVSEAGILDIVLLPGPTAQHVTQRHAALTGCVPLPPRFALGYHQCRWNYTDQADVEAVDAAFTKHDIPADVIWLDIEHTQDKRYLTWDKDKFPDPTAMQASLARSGRRMVAIIDPHIKRDADWSLHQRAEQEQLYVRTRDGAAYDGWCWPGSSSWLDYTNPAARSFWADALSYPLYLGSTERLFVWNDMNEPSVFTGPEVTMPRDLIHWQGWEHRQVHNLYGFYQSMATYQGLVQRDSRDDAKRPFALTRSFFTGSQRYAAVWTGDNKCDWEHLRVTLPMLQSLSLAGISFCGADVPGFFGEPTPELTVRWYQAAAFQPFFRAHAHNETKRREPWCFDPPTMACVRAAIRARYHIIAYLYTAFRKHETTGTPVMRPIWLAFPDSDAAYDEPDAQMQWMLGDDVMVAPVLFPGQEQRRVWLPEHAGLLWYLLWTGRCVGTAPCVVEAPLTSQTPVLVRGGSIIPWHDEVAATADVTAMLPITLIIAVHDGAATGSLYLDDGHSFAYQRCGQFLDISFRYSASERRVYCHCSGSSEDSIAREDGRADLCARIRAVRVLGWDDGDARVGAVSQDQRVMLTELDQHNAVASFSVDNALIDASPLRQAWHLDLPSS